MIHIRFFQSKLLLPTFFLLFLLTSCEKIKDLFTDEYAFLKGEWVLEEMEIRRSGYGSGPSGERSYSTTYSYINDSITYSYRNYWFDYISVNIDTSYSQKYAYSINLDIDKDIEVIASLSNKTLEIERDTTFSVQQEYGEFDNIEPSIGGIPVEYYQIKIPFGRNRFFIEGVWKDGNENVLFVKKDQEKNKLVIEYKYKVNEQESSYSGDYMYKFKRIE